MEPSCSSSFSSSYYIEEEKEKEKETDLSFESSFIHDFDELNLNEKKEISFSSESFWENFMALNLHLLSHEKIDLLSIDSLYWTIPFHEDDEKNGILPLERLMLLSDQYPLIKTVLEELHLHRKSILEGTISLLFQSDDLFQCSQEKLRLIFLQILSISSNPTIMTHYGLDNVEKIVDLFHYARLVSPRDLSALHDLVRFVCFHEKIESNETTMHYFRKLLSHNVIPEEFVSRISKYVHSFYQVIISDEMNYPPLFLPNHSSNNTTKKVLFSITEEESIQEICPAWSHTRYFLKWNEDRCCCQNKIACSVREITLETLPFCYCEDEDFCIRRAVQLELQRQEQFY